MLVECYYKATDGGETDELIQDAIADILHYAFSVNKDFPSACLRMAERHFRVEAGLEAE